MVAGEPATGPLEAVETRPHHPKQDEWFKERAEQSRQNFEHMEKKFPNPPECPFCHNREYQVSERLALYPTAGSVLSVDMVPIFLVICQVCGYAAMFQSRVALARGDEPVPSKGQEGSNSEPTP